MTNFKGVSVNVGFTLIGTWGGVGFSAKLSIIKKDEPIFEMFDLEQKEDEYTPVLEITDGPKQYVGLMVYPNDMIPGLFANYGDDKPLSNKCYLGEMQIGDCAADLQKHSLPSVVFPSKVTYLHINEEEPITEQKRALLLEVVRFDNENRFPAGLTISRLFTKEEMEGDMKGKVFYA